MRRCACRPATVEDRRDALIVLIDVPRMCRGKAKILKNYLPVGLEVLLPSLELADKLLCHVAADARPVTDTQTAEIVSSTAVRLM